MDIKATLKLLQKNSVDELVEALRLLVKIANNIILNPSDEKFRKLNKSNTNIANKILKVKGGVESLHLMGFEEDGSSLVISHIKSLDNLKIIRDDLNNLQIRSLENSNDDSSSDTSDSSESSVDYELQSFDNLKTEAPIVLVPYFAGENCKPCRLKVSHQHIPDNLPKLVLPQLENSFSNPFLTRMQYLFHIALGFKDKNLLEFAKRLIPVEDIERKSQEYIRSLQDAIKKGECQDDSNLTVQDAMILSVLSWFKNSFFKWVDSPACTYCKRKTQFAHMGSNDHVIIKPDSVEMHKCNYCNELTPFARYSDPYALLITRQGRCGEWAKAFTLICCAMGWEARIVFDETDHVWTEVFSYGRKKWIHCDPCENTCDKPFMYEVGWNKKLSYCIAYSAEEVQDVTWRYSYQHKEILKRRNKCREDELINAMIHLRQKRQESSSVLRQRYATMRLLEELADFLVEKNPSAEDNVGRLSGDLAWRLARGEKQTSQCPQYTWLLSKEDVDAGDIAVQYSIGLDRYEYKAKSKSSTKNIPSWINGTFSTINIFRKEEEDWQKVYLARTEQSREGSISWRFTVDELSKKVIDQLTVKFLYEVYKNGKVDVRIEGDNSSVSFPENTSMMSTKDLSGSKSVHIKVSLSLGEGDVAWQHAQLFRDSLKNKNYQFCVQFKFKELGQ